MRLIGKALVGFAVLVLVDCGETREDSFPSMSTPQGQAMVSRGWIPSSLPRTATDVRVRSNIDTNMVRGKAHVVEADLVRLRTALRPLADDVTAPFWMEGDITPSWWPAELLPPGRTSDLRTLGLEVFLVPDRVACYMALHTSDGWVYFWSDGS